MNQAELQVALDTLSVDPVLKEIIKTNELPVFETSGNLYFDLVDSIISQQLSVKAAATILGRFLNLFETKPHPTPDEVLLQTDESLRSVGISFSKIKYIKGLSLAVTNNELDLATLPQLSDEEVISELIKIKGIGKWTAEMILIFSLNRPDIFSVGDLGLRTTVSKLYNIDRDNLKDIERISQTWSPYRSIASRYLWKSLNNTPKNIIP
jgi:DNA-3-methyladenine glycosylase II